jgi:hypothetical protein
VESLHTIAESLPGLLAEGSPSAARAALMAASSQHEDGSHVSHVGPVLLLRAGAGTLLYAIMPPTIAPSWCWTARCECELYLHGASPILHVSTQVETAQAHPDRKFRVRGKLQPDMEKLNLRLRILEPEGAVLPASCGRVFCTCTCDMLPQHQ